MIRYPLLHRTKHEAKLLACLAVLFRANAFFRELTELILHSLQLQNKCEVSPMTRKWDDRTTSQVVPITTKQLSVGDIKHVSPHLNT
jgi:hypothetical protein